MVHKSIPPLVVIIILTCITQCDSKNDSEYEGFLNRLKAEEDYIGYFETESKCISDINDAYIRARRELFIAINRSKEEPFDSIEKFIEFCKNNSLLNQECEEKWEKVLTILSFELYANMPIFEFSTKNITEHRDLIFAEYPNKKLGLDLFLPKDPIDKPIPCIVAIHGGGWRVNRRLWFEPFAKYLASHGFAAVTIDYRMLPAVKVIDCVYDSKAAVRWVRSNAEKYNIDPNRIGAIGASAGAHLVTLLGTTADVIELEGKAGNNHVSSEVQAVVGIATPAFNMEKESWLNELLGASIEEMKLISPYEYISPNSAPLYLIHGTTDKTVTPDNSQDLYDKYSEVGAYVELTWIEGEGHGFYEGNDRAIKMATSFFKKQFKNN